jgi:hypothetical protein
MAALCDDPDEAVGVVPDVGSPGFVAEYSDDHARRLLARLAIRCLVAGDELSWRVLSRVAVPGSVKIATHISVSRGPRRRRRWRRRPPG